MTTTLMRLIVAACVVTGLVMTAALPAMAQSRVIRIVGTGVSHTHVEIGEVEEDVLLFFT